MTPLEFAGGGLYNSIAKGVWDELKCKVIQGKYIDKHPFSRHQYSSKIRVNINKLNDLYEKLLQ